MALSITKLARNVGRRNGYSFLRQSKSLNKLSSQVSTLYKRNIKGGYQKEKENKK